AHRTAGRCHSGLFAFRDCRSTRSRRQAIGSTTRRHATTERSTYMRRKRSLALLLTLMLVVTSVGGFLGATGAGAQDRPVLRFGSSEADIQSLDPHVAT